MVTTHFLFSILIMSLNPRFDNQEVISYYLLRRHWRSTIDQDILLSDTYEIEESIISYTVDDDGRDYLIDCDITTKSYHYTMQVKIDMETLDMHECIYGH